MRIISQKPLREFWTEHADAEIALRTWCADTKQAQWKTPADIKNEYANASFLADSRVVSNIRGNKYRLIVKVEYGKGAVYVCFIGTHAQYDRVDANTVGR